MCGFAYKRVSIDEKFNKDTVVFRGDNCVEHFIECLLQEEKEINEILYVVKPMVLTDEDEERALKAKSCFLCKKRVHTLW